MDLFRRPTSVPDLGVGFEPKEDIEGAFCHDILAIFVCIIPFGCPRGEDGWVPKDFVDTNGTGLIFPLARNFVLPFVLCVLGEP